MLVSSTGNFDLVTLNFCNSKSILCRWGSTGNFDLVTLNFCNSKSILCRWGSTLARFFTAIICNGLWLLTLCFDLLKGLINLLVPVKCIFLGIALGGCVMWEVRDEAPPPCTGFPLDLENLENLEKWEYTWKTWKYHGILKKWINIMKKWHETWKNLVATKNSSLAPLKQYKIH